MTFRLKEKYNFPKMPHGLQLLLIAAIGYWPITTLMYSPKWDMLDTVLPWRYFVSECLRNGELPLWNPYQQAGYPIFADLRSVWYLETIFTAYFFGVNIYLLHFLMIFYFFLAGYGMYRLLKFLEIPSSIAFLAGVTYLFSGFMVSQGQDMVRIIAAAGLPFVIWFYLRFLKEKSSMSAVCFSIVFFLMITGAYQAVTIILSYLLALFFCIEMARLFLVKEFQTLKKTFFLHFFVLVLICVLILPLLISFIQAKPFVSRFEGLDLKWAEFLPFSIQSSISFLLPFASVKENLFFDTDISMRNAYFGIICLVFFIASFFRKKTAFEKILLVFGIFALFASFGNATPVREFLYHYFPLMNLFRMPSYFVLFFSFSAIIISAFQIKHFLQNKNGQAHILKVIIGFLVLLFVSLVVFSGFKIDFKSFSFFKPFNNLSDFLERSSIYEHVFIQSLLQLFFLLGLLLVLKIENSKKLAYRLSLLIILDLFISIQLNVFYTVADTQSHSVIQEYVESSPKGFPIPANLPINQNSDYGIAYASLWRNNNIYEKRISFDGYNSFCLNGFEELEKDSLLFHQTLSNPIVFLSNKVCSKMLWEAKTQTKDQKLLVLSDQDFKNASFSFKEPSLFDTCYISGFSPNKFTVEVKTENRQMLTLLQSNFYGWKVFVDGKKTDHYVVNKNFISIIIPKGKHQVVFKYQNVYVIYAGVISILLFLILLLIISIPFLKTKRIKLLVIVAVSCLVLYGFLVPKIYAKKYFDPLQKNQDQITAWIKTYQDSALIVNNINYAFKEVSNAKRQFENKNDYVLNHNELCNLYYKIKNSHKKYLIYTRKNCRLRDETFRLISAFYPEMVECKNFGIVEASIQKNSSKKEKGFYHSRVDFDKNDESSDSIILNEKQKLNVNNPFSENIVLSAEKLDVNMESGYLFHASINTISELKSEAFLVMQVDNNGVLKSWNTMPVNKKDGAQKTDFFKLLKPSKNDIIKVFLWNPGSGYCNYDNLELNLY